MVPRTQPQYTPEQREEALRIVEQSGKSTYEVARDLGISQTTLHRWQRQASRRPQSEHWSQRPSDY